MFRIVCMVDDKKLVSTLRTLAGLHISVEPPQVVANAKRVNGKTVARAHGPLPDRVLSELLTAFGEGKEVSIDNVREAIRKQGGAVSAVYTVTSDLKKRGVKGVSKGRYR